MTEIIDHAIGSAIAAVFLAIVVIGWIWAWQSVYKKWRQLRHWPVRHVTPTRTAPSPQIPPLLEQTQYFRTECSCCSNFIEYPKHGVGQEIKCPLCRTDVKLLDPDNPNKVTKFAVPVSGLTLGFLAGISCGFYFAGQRTDQTAVMARRDEEIKARLDAVQSEALAWKNESSQLQKKADDNWKLVEAFSGMIQADNRLIDTLQQYNVALKEGLAAFESADARRRRFALVLQLEQADRQRSIALEQARTADKLSRLNFNLELNRDSLRR